MFCSFVVVRCDLRHKFECIRQDRLILVMKGSDINDRKLKDITVPLLGSWPSPITSMRSQGSYSVA